MTNQKTNKLAGQKRKAQIPKKGGNMKKKKNPNTNQKGGNMKKKKPPILKLTQDIVFKSFFSTNTEILKKVLERFIPELGTISKVKFLNTELVPEYPKLKDKKFFLDLLVELETGEKVNIEMQNAQEEGFFTRVLGYMMRMQVLGFKSGKGYNKVKPNYSLIFLSKPAKELKKVQHHLSHFALVRTKPPHVLLTDKLHIKVVELSKLSEENLENLDIVGKWCYFIRKSGELSSKEIEILSKEPELKMALKHFESLSQDQELIQIQKDNSEESYNNALEFSKNQGIKKGIKEGMKKGKEKERKILVNLLKKKMPISFISEVTAWSEEKVLKLIKDLGFKE